MTGNNNNNAAKTLAVLALCVALMGNLAVLGLVVADGRMSARERTEACERQAASTAILRLFLTDHADIRENVPPDPEHPDTLPTIEDFLDEADCPTD